MGTNYYSRGKHIGKSSVGWYFSLHVYPEEGINTWQDWLDLFFSGISTNIRDEYNKLLSVSQLINIVTDRRRDRLQLFSDYFLNENNAEVAKYNLLRRRVDGVHCIGHGPGTYDYCIGEFS